MGQRQSSQQSQQPHQQQQSEGVNSNNTSANNSNQQTQVSPERPSSRSQAAIRPTSRVQAQRDTLRSAVIPVNDNQRRDERRLRRERLREQQERQEEEARSERTLLNTVSAAMAALGNNENTTGELNTTLPPISPFSRMIASVISEAVITSFRNGQIYAPGGTDLAATEDNVRQQLTMHLSPEVFRQMEPGSSEDTFMRFMRLPVIVSSVPREGGSEANNVNEPILSTTDTRPTVAPGTTAVNADGQAPTLLADNSEVTRLLSIPLFLYGSRSNIITARATDDTSPTTANPTEETIANNEEESAQTAARRSARIRAQQDAQQQPEHPTMGAGQWTVYIISGSSVDGIMNDNPSYEELLDLATLLGPARRQTVSQEAIDNHIPIVKYTEQIKDTILGNSEKCPVCLSEYIVQEDVRVLDCHHGFHSSKLQSAYKWEYR
jgi:hypothetical protein